MLKTKDYHILSNTKRSKWRIAFKGILVGILAGLLTVLYRIAIEYGTEAAGRIYSYLREHPGYLLAWIMIILVAGIFVGWMIKKEPMAGGSGIPQTEGVVIYGLKMKWYRILAVRYIGGTICSFFGLSVGREGPSIQIGASGGQIVAEGLHSDRMEENCLITGGAAAGLSAAFNAPLSGIIFALEEVHRSFSPMILLAAATASLTADLISKNFFGLKPVLQFAKTPQLPINLYFWIIPIGILSGIMGVVMNKFLLGFQSLYHKLPVIIRPCIAFLIALPCGLFLPEVLGGGQQLIEISENAREGIMLLGIFLIAKLIFTSTSFGSGVPGGIFLPILSVGALTGGMAGQAAAFLGMPTDYIPDFAVCAMAGVLSAAVKAPITSILLIAEMSGSLVHLLPVAACSFLALLVSDFLKTEPIYEALLERFVEKNGKKLPVEEKGDLREFSVAQGSSLCRKMVKQITWPKGVLIVNIQRGDKEIIPQGDTVLLPGDYLIVLTADGTDPEIQSYMEKCNQGVL